MKFQAVVLSIALLFGVAAFAQSTPSTDAKAPVSFMNLTTAKDAVGFAFAAELEKDLKATDGLEVTEGLAEVGDTMRPEIRVVSNPLSDTTSYVTIVVTVHIQGKNLSVYVGTLAKPMTAADVKDLAAAAERSIGGALAQIEPYLDLDYSTPAPPQRQAPPDNTEKS